MTDRRRPMCRASDRASASIRVFRDHIATMERRELASTLERRYEERFQIPLALARPAARRRSADAARRGAARHAAQVVAATPSLSGPPACRCGGGCSLPCRRWSSDSRSAGRPRRRGQRSSMPTANTRTRRASYGERLIDAPGVAAAAVQPRHRPLQAGQVRRSDHCAANKVAASGEPQWVARANDNPGNAHYRLGANAETGDPQAAIKAYEEALACYKRSHGRRRCRPLTRKLDHEFVPAQSSTSCKEAPRGAEAATGPATAERSAATARPALNSSRGRTRPAEGPAAATSRNRASSRTSNSNKHQQDPTGRRDQQQQQQHGASRSGAASKQQQKAAAGPAGRGQQTAAAATGRQ